MVMVVAMVDMVLELYNILKISDKQLMSLTHMQQQTNHAKLQQVVSEF
jgi:succinate dehydrogenase flavin-adding protein (antitoxin of CptAB toxin-antitoxin module)